MIEKIKTICISKTNIFAVALSTFAFLKDIQELFTSFASHLLLVLISIAVLSTLLTINLLFISNSEEITDESSNQHKVKNQSIKANFKLNAFLKSLLIPKVLLSTIIFVALISIGAIYKIKNMGVYYVVLQSELNYNEAEKLMINTNSNPNLTTLGLKCRIIKLNHTKCQLILYNGYVDKIRAEDDLKKILSANFGFNPYIVGPQNVANLRKKIKYLQHTYFD